MATQEQPIQNTEQQHTELLVVHWHPRLPRHHRPLGFSLRVPVVIWTCLSTVSVAIPLLPCDLVRYGGD